MSHSTQSSGLSEHPEYITQSTPGAPKKRVNAAKNWCFTWNNYPDNHREILRNAFRAKEATKWMVQEEIAPTTGKISFKLITNYLPTY